MSGAEEKQKGLYGYLVEFKDVDSIINAARKVRDEGYRNWDCHTPFPVHGLDGAMGIRMTILPLIVFAAGLTGFSGGLLMQWWMNAYDYTYLISGKPFWSIPANIPVAFETTVLLSAFGAFFGMFGLNQLPEFYHSLFKNERFRRATSDRFILAIEAKDPRFDLVQTRKFLDSLGGEAVEEVEE